MQRTYRRLVHEYCILAGLDNGEAIADGCTFRVDEVDCSLIHLGHLSQDSFHCHIDFGPVPEAGCLALCRRLLETNHQQLASGSAAFSLSPETGHVVLISTLKLSGASPETLADLLGYHAHQALEWRSSFYPDHAVPALLETNENCAVGVA